MWVSANPTSLLTTTDRSVLPIGSFLLTNQSIGPYYFVDGRAEELVVVPALLDAREETRVRIDNEHTGTALEQSIPPGGRARVPLRDLLPLKHAVISLLRERAGAWSVWQRRASLEHVGEFAHAVISPAEWGVHADAIAVLREAASRAVVARRFVAADNSVEYVYPVAHQHALTLEFHRAGADRVTLGERIGPTLRWTPTDMEGASPSRVHATPHGMSFTSRRDVTLAPRILRGFGERALRTEGYLGAWNGGEPIPEAMDFVMGRQEMLFHPEVPEPTARYTGRVIYMGRPHGSWGHFLTQGLARSWYAMEHPDVPIVWDNPRPLPAYQQQVLDMIGVRNKQIFLTEASHFEEVVFPYPGVCIGDYVLPEFARAVGNFAPATLEPGKKLFLSRSGTSNFPGGIESELDRLLERFGFAVFRPEQHDLEKQLVEISSAEVVLAVEGSSLHTPLLLKDPINTQFWALSRHRRGAGLFEHIRTAKSLDYQTLNFLRSRTRRARDPIDLDLGALEDAMRCTGGLEHSMDYLTPFLERPDSTQLSYGTHLQHTQVVPSAREAVAQRAQIAIYEGDIRGAEKLLSLMH